MSVLPAPFQPLTRDADGLDVWPTTAALQARMGEIYGVSADRVLPVRGATHGVELTLQHG